MQSLLSGVYAGVMFFVKTQITTKHNAKTMLESKDNTRQSTCREKKKKKPLGPSQPFRLLHRRRRRPLGLLEDLQPMGPVTPGRVGKPPGHAGGFDELLSAQLREASGLSNAQPW